MASIIVPVGATGESIIDVIQSEDRNYDFTGLVAGDVRFRARLATSNTVVIDGTASQIDTGTKGKLGVRYDPAPADVATERVLAAWWTVTLPGGRLLEPPEFPLIIDAHSPGTGVTLGVIASRSRSKAPVAWDALSGYAGYGDAELLNTVELAKLRVFNGIVLVSAENAVDLRVVDYVATMVAIDVLAAAIDYWSDVLQSRTSRGTDEIETYPSRIQAASALLKEYRSRLPALQRETEILLPDTQIGTPMEAPADDAEGRDFISPGLESFPRLFLKPGEISTEYC